MVCCVCENLRPHPTKPNKECYVFDLPLTRIGRSDSLWCEDCEHDYANAMCALHETPYRLTYTPYQFPFFYCLECTPFFSEGR
jgi:hypothetical protein